MQIRRQKIKYEYQGAVVIVFLLFASMGAGCTGAHKTTTTKTTVTYPNKGVVYQGGQQAAPMATASGDQQNKEVVEKSETTTTTTETKAKNPGVLSSTFHAIGYVISLPFIIVGGLLRIIFGG